MALKHIYTVLISNHKIEITVDLPQTIRNNTEESEPSILSENDFDDNEVLLGDDEML